MSEKEINTSAASPETEEQFSLNDDRRVKSLSPGALVAKRFFRNRLAVVGLVILAFMFIFSFVGGWVMPYTQEQVFFTDEMQMKEFAGATENNEYRYISAEGQDFGAVLQAKFTLAEKKGDSSFENKDIVYTVEELGPSLYTVSQGDTLIGAAYKDLINPFDQSAKFSFEFTVNALEAYVNEESSFKAEGASYTIDDNATIAGSEGEIAYISRVIVQSKVAGTNISRELKELVSANIADGITEFSYTDAEGTVHDYLMEYNAADKIWSIKESTATRVFLEYDSPSKEHPLGTDKNGMDMITRLMYGGRISLIIGFIVVFISAFIGVILGGLSGYFGKWVDQLIMRIVDIFYCIPSTPLLIILGAAMDGMRVDPMIRMLFLMLILGFLGWPGIARLVRGQILSLREQEFMTATESSGLRVSRRIFKHLIPNVIPQLIVTCTMSLGSTIITESTLSFLGLGVKFPFASWGNIMNDVNNVHVLTNYWFIWIPAGVLLVLTVLGFNFVGDGLRDAFDPKMKR